MLCLANLRQLQFGACACRYLGVGWVLGKSLAVRPTMVTPFIWAPFSSMEASIDAPSYSLVVDLPGENLVLAGWAAVALSVSCSSLEALPLVFACHGVRGQPTLSLGGYVWLSLQLVVLPHHPSRCGALLCACTCFISFNAFVCPTVILLRMLCRLCCRFLGGYFASDIPLLFFDECFIYR